MCEPPRFSVFSFQCFVGTFYESVKAFKCVKLELPAGRESRCANHSGFQCFSCYIVPGTKI